MICLGSGLGVGHCSGDICDHSAATSSSLSLRGPSNDPTQNLHLGTKKTQPKLGVSPRARMDISKRGWTPVLAEVKSDKNSHKRTKHHWCDMCEEVYVSIILLLEVC